MKALYISISLLYSLLFPSRKIVYFCSFFGQYSDNPKYIFCKLKELYPDIKTAWTVSSTNENIFPDNTKKVQFQSFLHYFYVYNAAIVVDNNMGLRQYLGKNSLFSRYFYRMLSRKSSKQLNISTWHGTPYKCIGKDSLDFPHDNIFYHNTDYTIAGCDFTYQKIISAFGHDLKILRYGTPRNDIFFNDNNIECLKRRLQLPLDKKMLLFAPTFRKDPDLNGARQLSEIKPEVLIECLNRKFHEEWVIVCRFHSHVLTMIKSDDLYNDIVINGNLGDDMQEYLLCADALITDFSSCMFDFALTKKTCFLFASDFDNYTNTERGLYITLDNLPFSMSRTTEELCSEINKFDGESYSQKNDSFLHTLGNFEIGQASIKISDDIYLFYYHNVKPQY